MKNKKLESIIKSEKFQNEIKDAIESGKEIDYGFDESIGEECEFVTFNANKATTNVISVLEKYFNKK